MAYNLKIEGLNISGSQRKKNSSLLGFIDLSSN
jgi:hypothetical protein